MGGTSISLDDTCESVGPGRGVPDLQIETPVHAWLSAQKTEAAGYAVFSARGFSSFPWSSAQHRPPGGGRCHPKTSRSFSPKIPVTQAEEMLRAEMCLLSSNPKHSRKKAGCGCNSYNARTGAEGETERQILTSRWPLHTPLYTPCLEVTK